MHQGADTISCKVVLPTGDGGLWMVQYTDGHRSLPGGRAEPGETFEVAARRELQEEIGARVGTLKLVDAWLMLQDPRRDGQDCLVLLYMGDIKGKPSDRLSAEGEQAVRVSLADIAQTELRPAYQAALQRLIQRGKLA